MNVYGRILLLVILLLPVAVSHAELQVPLQIIAVDGTTHPAGVVSIAETPYGLVFTPDLKGLTPGLHGFHVHQKPSCALGQKDGKSVPALAAGGHFDPHKANRHGPPWGGGHLGDLPVLYADKAGNVTTPVLAPRLKLIDVKGRALIIHTGGDNYSDQPKTLGGGGARMACGVID